ncbi:unnamed protein product [Thelazia callipaeda]|uniref:WD_REPEATS_REGION domain-containing protein n=1 Tax=Thelazia callipaeda TaxID=103827 RepID=A0A0N5DAD4_THECL|nr:unnamed protein product [Thelazia callipaeda]
MRLEVVTTQKTKHKDSVLSVAWIGSDEVVSAGDDQQALKWNLTTYDAQLFMQLPKSLYPTNMQWFPYDSCKQQFNEIFFILTSTEGKFYICNRNGHIEKAVEAHQGAVLSSRWSHDGSTFATCGEDGVVKLWSRSGMLRSIISENSFPVYGICWNENDSCIAFCCDDRIFIKSLKSQSPLTKWKAHDCVVLCLDWSVHSNLLVSGGEDCKYKVWDEYGRVVYSSSAQNYPITSVAWNTDGDLFAVGSFNLLRLCDKAGWSHSLQKLSTGSIYSISWSPDGTQLAGGCSDGTVLLGYLVEKRLTWRNIEAVQIKPQVIDIRDVLSDLAREKLEVRDRITKLSLSFDHFIIATTRQCYIFSVRNWNTPIIMDLKECNVLLMKLCEKYFLLVDGGLIQIYNYDGRMQCSIKLPSLKTNINAVNEKAIAISNDTVAIRDRTDSKIIYFFETTTGKSTGNGKLIHTNEITELAIDQCGSTNNRKLAFIDKSLDCYLALVKTYGISQKVAKIGTMVTNIRFNDHTNMLAGLQDNHLIIWLYPATVFIDRNLLQKTVLEKDDIDFGKSPYLLTFVGNHISVRRSDGALIPCTISPFPAALITLLTASKWDQSIRLCRHVNEDQLWGIMAVVAIDKRNFYAAEMAYSALNEVEKVLFLTNLQSEQSKDVRSAMMVAFTGNFKEADAMLVQSGHIFRAIIFNISIFQWQRPKSLKILVFCRALELAVKYKMHLETVIGYRQKYLQETGRKETDANFLQYQSEVEIDWDHIHELIREDENKQF